MIDTDDRKQFSSTVQRAFLSFAFAVAVVVAGGTAPAAAVEPAASPAAFFPTEDRSAAAPIYLGLFDPVSSKYKEPHGWWYESRPCFWMAGIDGTITAGNRSADVSVDFSDLLDKTNFGLSQRFDVGYDRIFVLVDGLYFNLGEDKDTRGGVEIETTLQQAIVEADLGYRLLDRPFGDDNTVVGPRLIVDALAGVRWTYFELELDPVGADSVGRERYWIDPIIGARARFALNEHWAFEVKGDIGGFGVGSELVWNINAQVEYQLFEKIALMAGYRVLDYDYQLGKVELDLQMSGPYVGAICRW